MSGIFNRNIGISIFGESHGPGIGVTINGLRPGITLDHDYIQGQMARRRPGYTSYSTPRKEQDQYEIISGVFEGKTTGTPLTMMIRNTDTRSRDYSKMTEVLRPGHADHTGLIRYEGFSDYRGSGHFSGRLTAGLVFAGALAKSVLRDQGIIIGAQISKIGHIRDRRLQDISQEALNNLLAKPFPTLDDMVAEEMKSFIHEVKDDHDSVGGEVRCFALNVPAGLGDPFFDSFESILSHLVFSVPAVKGISFGSGFKLSDMNGSESNDAYYYQEDRIKTRTNHNGGVIGGITNGMPVDFTVVVKPTASIGKAQETVNIKKQASETIETEGRHDPCIVPRVVPVLEAVLALTILDFMTGSRPASNPLG